MILFVYFLNSILNAMLCPPKNPYYKYNVEYEINNTPNNTLMSYY